MFSSVSTFTVSPDFSQIYLNFAAEGRKRVKDQLYVIDETFMAEPAKFKYIFSYGYSLGYKWLDTRS